MNEKEKDNIEQTTDALDSLVQDDTGNSTDIEEGGFKFLGDPTANAKPTKDKTAFKKLIPVLSLCLIATVLFVAVVVLKKAVPEKDPLISDINTGDIEIFDFTGTTADRMEIKNSQDEYAFVKKLTKTYYIEGKEDLPVANSTILAALTYFGSLNAKTEVLKDVTDFEQYGLTKPLSTVTWIKGDTKHYIEIGGLNTSSDHYMRVDGGSTVYTLDATVAAYFLSPRMDYYDTAVFEYDQEADAAYIKEFVLHKKGGDKIVVELQDLTEENLQSAYLITSPIEHQLSIERSVEITTLMANLTTLTVFSDDISPENLKKYGLDDPAYTFSFTNVQEVNTAYFGNLSDDGYYYVYAEGKDFIYIVDKSTIGVLDYDVADFCETMTYTRSYDTIDSLTISGMGKNYDIVITGTSEESNMMAYINNKAVEYENFATLYAHIISIDVKEVGNKDADDELLVTITVNCKDGSTDVLKYYKKDALNSFYELNGRGRLIVPTSKVEEIIKFSQMLYDGDEIIAEW